MISIKSEQASLVLSCKSFDSAKSEKPLIFQCCKIFDFAKNPYFVILRPVNCIMAAVAVLIGAYIANSGLSPELGLGMIAVFAITGAGMIINDYFDIEIDKTNKPHRPLPTGKITKKRAIAYSTILLVIGLFLSFLINYPIFIVAAIASLIEVMYAWKMKRVAIIGNVMTSLLVALTFLYGGLIASQVPLALLMMALMAFFANMGREFYKTIEDVIGDNQHEAQTTAVKYGVVKTKQAASVIIFIAVALSIVPIYFSLINIMYLLLISIADILFIGSLFLPAHRAEKLLKVAMVVALGGFLVGL